MGDQVSASQAQDDLRPLRAFVGALQGYLGSDQTMAGADASVYNPPRQFVVIGPNGVSVEGQPVGTTIAPNGGLVLPGWMLMLGLGALGFALFKKG